MSKINGITYGTYPSIRPKKNVDKSVCENCNICKNKSYQLADSLEKSINELDKIYKTVVHVNPV